MRSPAKHSLPNHAPTEAVWRAGLAYQDAHSFPMGAIWRAHAFRATEGQSMGLRRANALNAVLGNAPTPITPGELILGNGHSRFTADGDHDELMRAQNYLAPLAGRHFGTHADHAAPGYSALLEHGVTGLEAEVRTALAGLPFGEHGDRRLFLESLACAMAGFKTYLGRWATAAGSAAAECPEYSVLLTDQAADLQELRSARPRTLRQAVQLVFLMHTAYQMDDRYAMALGRADQYLYPFYQADIETGRIDEAGALALMEHLFAKLAHRGDIQNVCVGGLTSEGDDATNDLSVLIVDACRAVARPGGNLTARIHKGTPKRFLEACVRCIRTGSGFPAIYNDDLQVPALIARGYAPSHARDYCFVGCIEAHIPGAQAPWADSRFNLLRCVDLALRGGIDGMTGDRLGPYTAVPATWDDLWQATLVQMRHGLDQHTAWVADMEQSAADQATDLTSPLLSVLTADCIGRGRDINDGGAIYPANHGVAGMGIGSAADTLSAIRHCVFDKGMFTIADIVRMLDSNFEGYGVERKALLAAPKYGNDDESVDGCAAALAAEFGSYLLARELPGGGQFWGLMAANVQNVSAGREVGASADGRLSGEPLSDAASPSFGRDRSGPTAVARSVARLPYRLAPGGNVVNMKFHPTAIEGQAGSDALIALIRTCFELGGAQLQFNTVGAEMLRTAMADPERHGDLVVRVSGFSAYFTRLERAVQEDVLARTEHYLGG